MADQELKVLLIEDNPGDAFLMKFYLGESTSPVFNVSHAETVGAALDLLAKNKFDLILSDMNLPDSFGVDTIKTILGKFPGNLVMVLTGLTDEEVGLETVRFGAQDFLVKGKFDGKVLISSVLFAFERFKLNKQIDTFTKQLDEENSRLDTVQRLLNVGYVEFDIKSNTVFRTDFSIKMNDLAADMRTSTLEDAIKNVENPDELTTIAKDIIAKGGTGSFNYKRGGKEFKMLFECHQGKICGIIQPL